MGYSVVVVERNDYLGGHTHSWTDPATNVTTNVGVQVYHKLDIVHSYFGALNVSLTAIPISELSSAENEYVDFSTGNILANYSSPDPAAALTAYAIQYAKYPYLVTGFNLSYPVPEDLLLPFGQFIVKYNLTAAAQTFFTYGEGLGKYLTQPTLYAMKNFVGGRINSLEEGFLTQAQGDNSLLYKAALSRLGKDVLLESTVLESKKKANGTDVLVHTPGGERRIHARQLLVTIPPKLCNLEGFDLVTSQRDLFARFKNSAYYTGVIKNSGIPNTVAVTNIGANTMYNLPQIPGLYGLLSFPGAPGYHVVMYGSQTVLPTEQVQDSILEDVGRFRTANNISSSTNTSTSPSFATFVSHSPFELEVSVEDVADGFYERLWALQGVNGMFWTGAAWHTHDSSSLWVFTEEAVLPLLIAALR